MDEDEVRDVAVVGDMTVGVNGGQRARLTKATAAYGHVVEPIVHVLEILAEVGVDGRQIVGADHHIAAAIGVLRLGLVVEPFGVVMIHSEGLRDSTR